MNVAIVHYHLNHGGVTQVIANQLRARSNAPAREDHVRIALLCGGQTQGWPRDIGSHLSAVNVIMGVAPRLRYDPDPVDESGQLASQLRQQLSAFEFRPDKTILHVHNHSLGKNASLPGALCLLADDGYALLLQIHDFAEDYRPRITAFWPTRGAAVIPPQSFTLRLSMSTTQCSIDGIMRCSRGRGCRRTTCIIFPIHLRPMAVFRIETVPVNTCARVLAFPRTSDSCSMRCAIRRKNIGEALLWSVLGGPAVHVGVTLAPQNVAAQRYYRRWKRVARELRLQVHFEIGGTNGLPLDENLASADLVLTTSVTEGFGMAFLESWVAERALVGRDLPEITADFAAAGLQLEHLYDKLRVPIDLIGQAAFRDMLQTSYCAMLASYRRPAADEQELARMTAERRQGDTVDFADLDEHFQEKVLREMHTDSRLRDIVLRLNPSVQHALEAPCPDTEGMIMQNKFVACREYSLAVSGERLWQAYQEVMASPRNTRLSALSRGSSILENFLAPHRFRPIRG